MKVSEAIYIVKRADVCLGKLFSCNAVKHSKWFVLTNRKDVAITRDMPVKCT